MDKRNEIMQSFRTFCRSLGAHVREVQDGVSFTAMLWEDADSIGERDAAEIRGKSNERPQNIRDLCAIASMHSAH